MDLCGLMCVESINGKKYILVIVDDYSSNIQTDNGTEFFNQTLKSYYEDVGISYQTSVARTPQQNDIVKRRNQTLVEGAHTMLIFSKASLFLWAEVVATTCYTQNRSLILSRHNKTPYELLHDIKLYLKYFHVFGALRYPTNDSEDLGKLKPKADIGIFIGYSPAKKAYRIYNKRTRLIMETIHVEFDELTSMASKQFGSGPELQLMTPRITSSGLPSPSVVSRVPPAVAQIPTDTMGTPSSTIIDQDAPSARTENVQFDNDPFNNIFTQELSSEESSSRDAISSDLHHNNQPFDHLSKWTKNHPLNNVIGNLSRPVFTRRQLQTDSMWCYFDAFLTKVKLKNFKEALKESSSIEAMQEEIYEFD
ncbi:integrase, catalytic region, zinc finger, CCHC-type containing protein [Tanacetum coccineum]|uniref:Integrase, catalytic region, zinc finger, CCHC-type containing protein n=1 Tax=Tanacetum coccineum TaxID=301880 RepID=A0ABQ4XIT7_9ASTR